MAPRPTWKGVLQISLVRIPIKVFPATESASSLSFNQLHDFCRSRLQQRKWCPACEREVTSKEIVKGFEFEKGRYVILIEDELDAIAPESTRVIALTRFAPVRTLPFLAIDRAYYLVPDGPEDGPASRAHAVLVLALQSRVGIGKLAIYGREYLVAVGTEGRSLLLYTLHHAAEVREPPMTAALDRLYTILKGDAELALAQRVIAAMTGPLDLATFTDQYQVDVRRLIDAKIAGQEIVQPTPIESTPVLNLREALTQSLAAMKTAERLPMAKAALKKRRAS